MRFSLLALLLVGAASADHNNAWDSEKEYHYNLESRSFTGLPEVSNQYSGILMRGVLKLQPRTEQTVLGKLSKVELAPIHTELSNGWDSEIPEGIQEWQPLATSGKPFVVKLQRGVIKELIFDKDVPTWEVNIHKSAISQLQIDTQGENMISSRSNQPAEEESGNAMFKAMEDSVGGNCEVLYDLSPIARPWAEQRLQYLPGKEFQSKGELIEIMKTKDYEKCEQRVAVHFGIPGNFYFEPASAKNVDFLSKSSISEVTLTGNLKAFTIHSSVTTERIVLSPNLHDSKSGIVASRVNLTLSKVFPKLNPWPAPSNPESVGSLAYTYEQPFSPEGNDRNPGEPTLNPSFQDQELKTETSSEEQHKDHFDASSAGSSDESGKIELSDDTKKYYFQPTPTLNEPPQYPMLPLFIGNKGKAFSTDDNLDLVAKAKNLSIEIGNDVQHPDSIPQEQTLEKFTILIGVLRTMNIQQLRDIQEGLYKPSMETDEDVEGQKVKKNSWVAFRDAIASAGTGPALELVTELIKENKLDGFEIMSVVSTLSKAAKEPTPEYVNAFFKLATQLEARREDNPKTAKTLEALKDDAVSTSAILAFTELLRYAQVSRRDAHNRFPIYAFGSFTPKNNDALLRDYFPYLIEKLEKGIEENSARATVYIRALGNVAHPKTISVFERYLEGTKPSTIYQRQMMVIALDKMAVLYPKMVQGIAYRIYQNTGESFKIRGLAVFIVIKTNPSLAILQRMAQFTNQDVSKHVNSIVKSLIESVADMKEEEGTQEIVRNARIASTFLTPETYGNEYSAGHWINYYLKELNIHYATELSWIDAEDSAIPQGIYQSFNTLYGGFKAPKAETGIMVTSIKDFYKTLRTLFKNLIGDDEDQSMMKKEASPTETIVKLLDIEGRNKEKFEFFFLSREKYSSSYFVVGEDLLSPIPQEYIRFVAESLKSGKSFNFMRLQNYEFTVAFPTATGLPFVFDFQIPRLRKLSGKIQVITSPDFSQGSMGTPQKIDAALDLQVIISQKAQSRFGFVTPFGGQEYLSGVDRNLQVHIPINTKINYDAPNNEVRVEIEPMSKNEESNLFHYSTVPFTSRQAIGDLKPTSSENRPDRLVMKQEIEERTIFIGKQTPEWSFKITEYKPEESLSAFDMFTDNESALEMILYPMARREVKYHAIDVQSIPSPSSEQTVKILIGWDAMSKNEPATEPSSNSHRWASKPEVSEPSDKEPGSPIRRKEMMNEALKGLPIGEAIALDIAAEMSGPESTGYIQTTAAASSKVDGKYKALVYVRTVYAGNQREPFEACATAQGSSPRVPPFDSSKIKREELERNLDIKFGVGKSCSNGVKSELIASQWQSPEFRKSIEKHQKMYKNMGIPNTFMDRAHVILRNARNDLDANWLMHPKNIVRSKARKNNGLKRFIPSDSSPRDDAYVSIDVDVEPGTKKALLNVKAPMMNVDFVHEEELTQSIIPMFTVQSDESYEERSLKKIGQKGSSHRLSAPEGVCLLEKDYVNTFDGAEYPLNMTNCWYVAITSVPEKDSKSSKPGIKSDKQASITIRKDDLDETKREVSLSLGKDKIELTKPSTEIAVKLNQKPINLANGAHLIEEGDDDELEIIKLSSEAVRVESEKYGLQIIFDGYRVQIQIEDKYRDSVRGLCGNFDSEPSNDLLTPHNRLSSKPQDFVALYILPVGECQSVSADLREQEKNLPMDKPSPNNVVSDRDAGRTTHTGKWESDSPTAGDKKKHRTYVRTRIVPVDDRTCFSVRPIPACAPGTKPLRVKTKLFPVYCLPNGESAKRLSDRINMGANPDFTQKSASMKLKLEIPLHCTV